MAQPPGPTKEKSSLTGSKRRINTQIHRRKKAKAVLPLIKEWDSASTSPPDTLRMPPERMPKH